VLLRANAARLSPELVRCIEIAGAPPSLRNLTFAQMEHPCVSAVICVITPAGGGVCQGAAKACRGNGRLSGNENSTTLETSSV
jgi:hypothetical protein